MINCLCLLCGTTSQHVKHVFGLENDLLCLLFLLTFFFSCFVAICVCLSSFLLNKTIDVLLYVDRLDVYRVDNLDKLVAKAITDSFGKEIWNKAIVALTHAQFSPPDGLPYDEFFSQRSEALLKVLRSGARLRREALQVFVSVT